MNELEHGLASLFQQAYEQGLEDGRREQTVEHKMIGRKQFDSEFGIKVDAFDKHYRNQESFPRPEGDGKWYAPAVDQWLRNHQQLSN